MSTKELSFRLGKLRSDLGYSQEQAAKELGVSRTALSSWERGTREPDVETMKKLADFYHCTVDYLLGYSGINIDDDLSPVKRVLFNKLKGASDAEAEQVIGILEVLQRTKNPSDY